MIIQLFSRFFKSRSRELVPYFANMRFYFLLQDTIRLKVYSSKRLGGHVDIHIVSRCRTRGEPEDYAAKKCASNGSTLALKLRVDVVRSPK